MKHGALKATIIFLKSVNVSTFTYLKETLADVSIKSGVFSYYTREKKKQIVQYTHCIIV